MSTKHQAAGDMFMNAVESYYDGWRDDMIEEGLGEGLPTWPELDFDQRTAWTEAFVMNMDLSVKMTRAVALTSPNLVVTGG